MSFNQHIQQMIAKAKMNMGFIFRNSQQFRNIQTMKTLYYAYVRSHLEFGMLVWDPITKTQTKAIEKIQRYFLKVLYLPVLSDGR